MTPCLPNAAGTLTHVRWHLELFIDELVPGNDLSKGEGSITRHLTCFRIYIELSVVSSRTIHCTITYYSCNMDNFRATAASICFVLPFTSGDVAPTFRVNGAGGLSHDWVSHDIPALWSHREGTNGGELSKTSSRRQSPSSARVARRPAGQHRISVRTWTRIHRSDAFPCGALITLRHQIINIGAALIDIGRVRIADAGRRAREDMTARRPSPRLQPDE
jgi:hypothetical protein